MSESIWDDPRITAFVLGEMSEQERQDFEMDVESNPELAAAIEEARTVTDQLTSLYSDESIPSLEDQRRAAIVSGGVGLPSEDRPRWWPRIGLALAIAAALLLMVGTSVYQSQTRAVALQRSASELSHERNARSDQELQRQLSDGLQAQSRSEQLPQAEQEARNSEGAALPFAVTPRRSSGQREENLHRELDRELDRAMEQHEETPDISITRAQSSVAPPAAPTKESVQLQFKKEAGQAVRTIDASNPEAAAGAVQGLAQSAPGAAGGDARYRYGRSGPTEVEFVEEGSTIILAGPADAIPRVRDVVEKTVVEELEGRVDALSALQDRPAVEQARKLSLALPASPSLGEPVRLEKRLGPDASVVLSDDSAPVSAGKSLELKRLEEQRFDTDFSSAIDEGRGPGIAGDRFEPITDNPFQRVVDNPLSTFSVDVDTASYSKLRDYLMRANQLPRPDAVRIEELVNYFSYDYEPPASTDEHPFAARVNVTSCPWNDQHRLARIALKGKTMESEDRPQCNLVFLLDTSGSMNASNKLPLVIEGMQMLLKQLNDEDQVAIAVYAGSAGLVLDSTPAKKEKKIRKALTQLSAGGSTNGGAGIALAYQTARDHFLPEGVNRVILCTDGDFNVGTTGTDELVRMVEQEAKGGVFLSVLGFGMGNHNDAMLEQISGRGNGNYAFIDSLEEARKVLVEQASGTLVTIAKDVKLQIEFNRTQVSSYRLIGYENRILAKEDFNDDKKDAGDIGAGHAVTALYEIVPAGIEADGNRPQVDALKYQQPAMPSEAADNGELLTLKLRYKAPDGDTSTLVEFPVVDQGGTFAEADDDVRFVAAVASFGMQLRHSPYSGNWTMSDVMNIANRAKGEDRDGLRAEFVRLVQKASELMGEE